MLLATPAHIGGFAAGLALQRPLLLWNTARPRLRRRLLRSRAMPSALRLQQPVQMDDDIFHLGIVDGALGGAAPGIFGRGVAVVNADQVDRARDRRTRGRAGP